MKQAILIFSMLVFFTPAKAQHSTSEEEKIKDVIQTAYVEGLLNEGDLDKVDGGFHPNFELLGIGENDEMWSYSISDWKQSVEKDLKAGKLPKAENERVRINFLFVDITENVAIAKFEFFVGNKLTYIDYQSLYKFPSGWKIVSKVYYKY